MQNIDEDIFRFIYIEAMKDAVNQKAYIGEKKWLYDDKDDLIKNQLYALTENVFDNKYTNQSEYDSAFLETANNVCKAAEENRPNKCAPFTFGNAQKLINMMLKYFYITCYKNDSMRKNFRFCHCPMDSKMLEKVWKERKILTSDIDLGERNFCDDSWGKEDFDDSHDPQFPQRYSIFQEAVRCLAEIDGITPIEYDYKKWK